MTVSKDLQAKPKRTLRTKRTAQLSQASMQASSYASSQDAVSQATASQASMQASSQDAVSQASSQDAVSQSARQSHRTDIASNAQAAAPTFVSQAVKYQTADRASNTASNRALNTASKSSAVETVLSSLSAKTSSKAQEAETVLSNLAAKTVLNAQISSSVSIPLSTIKSATNGVNVKNGVNAQKADSVQGKPATSPKRRGRPRKIKVEDAPLLAGLDMHSGQELSRKSEYVEGQNSDNHGLVHAYTSAEHRQTKAKVKVQLPENKVIAPGQKAASKTIANVQPDYAAYLNDMPQHKGGVQNNDGVYPDYAPYPEYIDPVDHGMAVSSSLDDYVLGDGPSDADYAAFLASLGEASESSVPDWSNAQASTQQTLDQQISVKQAPNLGHKAPDLGHKDPDLVHSASLSVQGTEQKVPMADALNNSTADAMNSPTADATNAPTAAALVAQAQNALAMLNMAHPIAAQNTEQVPSQSETTTHTATQDQSQIASTVQAMVQAQAAEQGEEEIPLVSNVASHRAQTSKSEQISKAELTVNLPHQNQVDDVNQSYADNASATDKVDHTGNKVNSANKTIEAVNSEKNLEASAVDESAVDMEYWLAAISGFAPVNALQSEKQRSLVLDQSNSSASGEQVTTSSRRVSTLASASNHAASTQESELAFSKTLNRHNVNVKASDERESTTDASVSTKKESSRAKQEIACVNHESASAKHESISANYYSEGFLDEDELASDSLASDDVLWKKQGLEAVEFAAAVRTEKPVLTPEVMRQVAENIAVNKELQAIKYAEAITIERNKTGEEVFDAAMQAQCCQPINLSSIKYLMDHYPMRSLEGQSRMNVVLMCLFQKMQDGHICINLDSVVNLFYIIREWGSKYIFRSNIERPMREDLRLENELRECMEANVPLSDQELLSLINQSQAVTEDGTQELPLVWDCNRLYVRRYYLYEQRICNYIKSVQFHDFEQSQKNKIKEMINVLFPSTDDALLEDKTNWQKVAALMSVMSDFTVISGGPGTGKTTTVFKLLLLLLNMDSKNRNILMCAPTAKAAARMGESISNQLKNVKNQQIISCLCGQNKAQEEMIRSLIPMQAETVHKLLKVRPHLSTPIFNENNKLNCDVLIVDEVSMLEMSLFAKLLAALPDGCKLILLGDKDQLSSVGAGMVLGDICSILNSTSPQRIQPQVLSFLQECSGYSQEQLLSGKIADHIVLLNYSWRSKDVPEIGQLAKLFNDSESFSTADDSSLFKEPPENVFARRRLVNEIISGQRVFKESKKNREYYDDRLCKIKQAFADAIPHAPTLNSVLDIKSAQISAQEQKASQITGQEQKAAYEQVSPQPNPLQPPISLPAAPLVLHTIPEALDNSNAAFSPQIKELVKDKMQQIAMQIQPDEQKEFAHAYNHPFSARDNRWLSEIMSSIREERSSEVRELRDSLVQSWVDPAGTDNYAPFLNALREVDFKVNPNSDKCLELFNLMDKFRVLCSNHSDWFGDSNLNERMCLEVLKQYHHSEKQSFTKGEFFPGQIVLITENDPLLNLVNGSVGFCAYADYDDDNQAHSFADYVQARAAAQNKIVPKTLNFAEPAKNKDTRQQQLKVFIPMGVKEVDGKSRTQVHMISTLLLHHYDIGYAMSIHKSQGSEYDHVAIVLSQHVNPILTKELVYTGITRAKKRVDLVASNSAMRHALSHAVVRESGLALRLYDPELLAYR